MALVTAREETASPCNRLPAYSLLKALAVNGAGYLANVCRMLANWGLDCMLSSTSSTVHFLSQSSLPLELMFVMLCIYREID